MLARAQPGVDADELRPESELPGESVHPEHRRALPGAELDDDLRANFVEEIREDLVVAAPTLEIDPETVEVERGVVPVDADPGQERSEVHGTTLIRRVAPREPR
jgi:hypothetical protein